MKTASKKTVIIFAIPSLLLATAFFGNLFVEGWNWSGLDFLVAGVFLFGTAFIIHLIAQSSKSMLFKIAVGACILLALALIWIELAVGIFGTPFAGS